MAQLTVAAAHLLDGQLEEAQSALDTALAIPAELLTSYFRRRLQTLGDAASHSHCRGTTYAGQIRDRIEDFRTVPELPAP